MANPLFNILGGKNVNNNGPMQMVKQFVDFKNNFKGNPREEVEKLIRSGAISQNQLNELQQMAQEFKQMFNL